MESTSRYCGGVVGFLERFVIVEDCFSDGPVIGGEQRTGGVGGSAGNYVEIRRCFARGDVTGRIGVAGILANGIAGNNAASFQADYHITVEHCIAWSARVAASGGETNQWGSGAVMGATAKYNTLKGNWRNPAMELSYNPVDTDAPILYDQEDADSSSGLLFYGGAESPLDYAQPVYHGKAAPSGSTLSSVAKSLSWPEATWDLSGDVPVLKR